MALYPEVQSKAQQEIDQYLKGERLPDFHDEPHLPYITAVVRELLRYVLHLLHSIPHHIFLVGNLLLP